MRFKFLSQKPMHHKYFLRTWGSTGGGEECQRFKVLRSRVYPYGQLPTIKVLRSRIYTLTQFSAVDEALFALFSWNWAFSERLELRFCLEKRCLYWMIFVIRILTYAPETASKMGVSKIIAWKKQILVLALCTYWVRRHRPYLNYIL